MQERRADLKVPFLCDALVYICFISVGRRFVLKRDSPTKFSTPIFSSFDPAWFWLRLRQVIQIFMNLPRVSYMYPSESYDFSRSYLKGQPNEIFDLFFSS